MDAQKYLLFWSAWFGFMGTLLSLQFCLYQIAIADSSKRIAQEFAKSPSRDSLISRAVVASSLLSNDFFGERIISKRAFFRGFLISIVVFLIAYTIAVATTPNDLYEGIQIGSPVGILSWISVADFTLLSPWVIAWSSSLFLAISWLAMEFFFVAKSRWIIRWVNTRTPWYLLIILFLSDIISSIIMMSVISPILIIIVGELFLYLSGDALNTNFIVITVGDHAELIPRPENLWNVYRLLSLSIGRDIWSHFHGDFHSYYVASIDAFPDKGCQVSGQILMNCHRVHIRDGIAVEGSYGVIFLVTTMFASALATTIWMAISVVTLILAKIFSVPGSVFLWIHENPKHILKYMILPTCIVSLLGGVAIPLFYLG